VQSAIAVVVDLVVSLDESLAEPFLFQVDLVAGDVSEARFAVRRGIIRFEASALHIFLY
jgi:hypothetical protein